MLEKKLAVKFMHKRFKRKPINNIRIKLWNFLPQHINKDKINKNLLIEVEGFVEDLTESFLNYPFSTWDNQTTEVEHSKNFGDIRRFYDDYWITRDNMRIVEIYDAKF